MPWIPLLQFPVEWAALSLLVVACLYAERSGVSGLLVEGALAGGVVGLLLGYEWTGGYATACAIGGAAAALFALIAGGLIHLSRADPAVGAFALSLVPSSALGLLSRATTFRLAAESPPPGLIRGTVLDGTHLEDLALNPCLWAAPLLIAAAAWLLWQTPFGLRLRAFGENPSWRVPGSRPVAYRLIALVVAGLLTLPAAALLARAHPDVPPVTLGYLALACAIASRWTVLGGVLLAAGPAMARAARPYAAGAAELSIAMELLPYLIALVYLLLLSRRALRLSPSPQTSTDPDLL